MTSRDYSTVLYLFLYNVDAGDATEPGLETVMNGRGNSAFSDKTEYNGVGVADFRPGSPFPPIAHGHGSTDRVLAQNPRRAVDRDDGVDGDGGADPGLQLTWKQRLKHFTWTWFTMTMATGGIANVLYSGM